MIDHDERKAIALEKAPKLKKWIFAMVEHGWSLEPTYDNEPVESAGSLTLEDDWKASYLCRLGKEIPWSEHPIYEVSLAFWHKGHAVTRFDLDRPYSLYELQLLADECDWCGERKPLTHVGFANAACSDCLPSARQQLEYRGWAE